MPWWAASKRPVRLSMAPVNAPRTWPNSSLSSRLSLRAPQLTRTNGRSRRSLSVWTAWAISSLPVPVSPNSSTDALERATWRVVRNTSAMAGLEPMMPGSGAAASSSWVGVRGSGMRGDWRIAVALNGGMPAVTGEPGA